MAQKVVFRPPIWARHNILVINSIAITYVIDEVMQSGAVVIDLSAMCIL